MRERDKLIGLFQTAEDMRKEGGTIEDRVDFLLANGVQTVNHGHWETISDSDLSKTVMCSVCNKMFYFTKKGQLNIDMLPYCPNCGAKMDGDNNA